MANSQPGWKSLALIAAVAILSTPPPASGQDAKRKPVGGKSAGEPPKVMSAERFRQSYMPAGRTETPSGSRGSASAYPVRFFGVEATGETIVFVIDNSTSMLDAGRLERSHIELRSAIARLRWPQKFHVIAFDRQTLELPWGPYVTAESENARRVGPWLRSLVQADDTRPAGALRMALGLQPDCVYFLTDGEFEDPTPETVRGWNGAGVPIRILDMSAGPVSPTLMRISQESGGSYRKIH